VGALPTWALSNHDSPRVATRLGVDQSQALFLALLALPGSLYIYNGQELSLPDAHIDDQYRQDPVYLRTAGAQKGRDGARVPIPWSSEKSECGFTSGAPWLPIPAEWREISVESQNSQPSSSLNLYRRALKARRALFDTDTSIEWCNNLEIGLLAFTRGEYLVLLNTSDETINYPCDGTIAIKSNEEIEFQNDEIKLLPHSSCWVKI